jgi:hypothetical protein
VLELDLGETMCNDLAGTRPLERIEPLRATRVTAACNPSAKGKRKTNLKVSTRGPSLPSLHFR